jgi:hypothetical protein
MTIGTNKVVFPSSDSLSTVFGQLSTVFISGAGREHGKNPPYMAGLSREK